MAIDSERIFAQALGLHQHGQLAQAESLYRQVLAASPQHLDALNLLGLVALQGGRTEEAIDLIARAIALNGRIADFHNNIAEAYRKAGRLDAAVEHFAKAAELEPAFLEAHQNLANVLGSQGEWARAAAHYRRVVAIKPDFAEAHNNLGIALKEQGQVEEAAAAFQQATALRPDFAEAHNNLGNAWRALGRREAAVAQFRRALALRPDFPEALRNLAATLADQGEFIPAADAARRAIEITDSADDKLLFVHCARNAMAPADEGGLRATLLRAWSELWGRPSDLAGLTVSLIKRSSRVAAAIARAVEAGPRRQTADDLWGPGGLAVAAGDGLLRHLLEAALVGDLQLERLLTATRRVVLDAASTADDAIADDVLAFCCALARQCFVNEYVFACTEDELERARRLRDSLIAALESEVPVPPLWPAVVAAYGPLAELPAVDVLLQRPWPEPLAGLIAQQVSEPREEMRCRGEIARLTTVEDAVSRQVRQQYEENPYPRWVDVGRVVRPSTAAAWVRARFPDASLDASPGTAEILIAGCGTGQQAIELAQTLPHARVLAVDLSLASLAYAQRKTRALGLDNLAYAQADILRLGAIGRTFDVIKATGVLHHLADPLAGWRVLIKLLRPRGLMHVGLYSEAGRQHIVAARDFIARRGYRPTAEDIRRCRQDLMMLESAPDRPNVTELWDFFSTSTCRDLLFHVHEHRMTLPDIDAFLTAEGLALVGLDVEGAVAAGYRRRFPDDAAMTNLAHWHAFEMEHPQTFAGMYLFWVRRRDR